MTHSKNRTQKIGDVIVVAWTLLIIGFLCSAGCTNKNGGVPDLKDVGITATSHKDRVQIEKITKKTHITKSISDSDLNWSLNELKTSKDITSRVRVLGYLLFIENFGIGQKQKIDFAINPLLQSKYPLDVTWAKKVKQHIGS
jgi:hypothetical protein